MLQPDFTLFLQHGWADDNRAMLSLAEGLATANTQIVAPSLDYLQTWLRIDPLIAAVEQQAIAALALAPETPIRIIGHSMGGLIWLEVLHRQRQWWPQVESLVLLGSPVGGSDLGRIFDPLKVGLGIAADLGRNRRALAATVASAIPTLVVAGDIDGGSDGTVTVQSTRVPNATFLTMPGINHPDLRNHPRVIEVIRRFWQGQAVGVLEGAHPIIQRLQQVPGMTDAHLRDFTRAKVWATFPDGSTVRVWDNPLGVFHVFFATPDGHCQYAGFVGWQHKADLQHALAEIQAVQASEGT